MQKIKTFSQTKECPKYETKPPDGKAPILELWGMWSTLSQPLLLSPLWPGVAIQGTEAKCEIIFKMFFLFDLSNFGKNAINLNFHDQFYYSSPFLLKSSPKWVCKIRNDKESMICLTPKPSQSFFVYHIQRKEKKFTEKELFMEKWEWRI